MVSSIALCLIYQVLYPGESDYVTNNNYGIQEYDLLFNDPVRFVTNIFKSGYGSYGAFFSAESSYWDDLSVNIIAKILAFTNIVANGNLLVNSLMFGVFGFAGSITFYKCFLPFFQKNSSIALIICFLLPSTLCYTSGVHKDSIVFFLVGLFFYSGSQLLLQNARGKYVLFSVLAWVGLLLMRNYVAMAILPIIVCATLVFRFKLPTWISVTVVYGGIFTLLVITEATSTLQPLRLVSDRQVSFLSTEKGNKQVRVKLLKPTIASFISATPQAVKNGLFTPYPLQFAVKIWWFFALENMTYLILLSAFLYNLCSLKTSISPFLVLSFIFALSMVLFIGFVVPNANAIIRYKSIYLPLLLVGAAFSIKKNNIKENNI